MDNLLLVGAQDQYEAGIRAAEKAADAAYEAVLADADAFGEWLGCLGHVNVPVRAYPRDAGALQLVVDRAAQPRLVCMLLEPRADVRLAAATELRRRYLSERGVA